MVKLTKSFSLMGTRISVMEKYEGMFESQTKFINKNKHLFKYRGQRNSNFSSNVVGNPPIGRSQIDHHPMKFPSEVIHAIKFAEGANSSLAFLMAKYLEVSDVNRYQNRLYIPKQNMRMYLRGDEKARVEKQGKEGGIDVTVIDPRGVTYNLKMKMWVGSGSQTKYVLIKEWAKLVRDNELQKDDLIELWCFRDDYNSKLHLAINVKRRVEVELRLGHC